MKVWVYDRKIWPVALAVLLAASRAVWAQAASARGVTHEGRTQVQNADLIRPPATPVPVVVLGIVAALDQNAVTLGLWHRDGTRSDLTASPKHLKKIRLGDPVSAVVDGSIVRNVERLDPPSPRV